MFCSSVSVSCLYLKEFSNLTIASNIDQKEIVYRSNNHLTTAGVRTTRTKYCKAEGHYNNKRTVKVYFFTICHEKDCHKVRTTYSPVGE